MGAFTVPFLARIAQRVYSPMARRRALSFLALFPYCFDNSSKSLFECFFPDKDYRDTDENGTASHNEHPEHPLLKGIHLAQVDLDLGLADGISKTKLLTVFKPASVMAEMTKKSESVYPILCSGVLEPQKITDVIRHVPMKYR